jgi:uncharacterized membrane protein YheB (UPF0754 family)
MRIILTVILFGFCGALLTNCGNPTPPVGADFTRADSLTDHYLSLHDSIHRVWNMMIKDDNQKINAMHHLIHELMVSHPDELESLKALEERLNQLMRARYTQKSMSNSHVVNEYDLAANEIAAQLLGTTTTKTEFSYNKTLQKLVEEIRQADVRINLSRFEYDSIATTYNAFIDQNREYLKETDETLSLEKKPLFRMASEE